MIYDRERLAWMGPWTFDANLIAIYYDSNDNEQWLYGDDDTSNVYALDDSYATDNGTAIATTLRTKKEDFDDWLIFKNMKGAETRFRNVQGSVNVDIQLQTRTGAVVTSKSFSVTPSSGVAGWGADGWGVALWGDSEERGGASDISEIYRWAVLNKPARNIQYIVTTSNANDKYELLGIQTRAIDMGRGFLPGSERV